MWRTSCGERTLEGPEARVFSEALLCLLDEVFMYPSEDYPSGVTCFDNLTYGQKVSVLMTVGQGLLRQDVPAVELNAAVEGAIAAVFEKLHDMVMLEIEEPDWGTASRQLVVAARQAMDGEEIPDCTCNDPEEWDFQIQELADAILWDADYEDGHLYLDQPPEKAQVLREMMRISPQYHLSIPDDLNDKEAHASLVVLRRLATEVLKRTEYDAG